MSKLKLRAWMNTEFVRASARYNVLDRVPDTSSPLLIRTCGKALRVLAAISHEVCHLVLLFFLCGTSAQGEDMRRPAPSKQFELFNPPTNTPLSAPGPVCTEVVSLLCALLLEVMPPQQPKLITAEEEQS